MRTLRKIAVAGLVACTVLVVFAGRAAADFVVREVEARIIDGTFHINTLLDMTLNAKPEEALNKGIPLDVVIDIALVEHRRFLWDRVVTDLTLRRHVQYHALSGQYLVSGGDLGEEDFVRFSTSQAALAYVGAIHNLELPLASKKNIDSRLDYSLRLRVLLDIGSLPTPLRPLAYATPSWHHNSGWTTWPVIH
jgi:hypothetical protein